MYLHVPDITIHSVRKISGRILDGFPIWGLDPSHGFWAPENWIPPAGLYLVTMGEHWPNIARQSRQKSRCSWSPVARPRWFQMIPMARYMFFFRGRRLVLQCSSESFWIQRGVRDLCWTHLKCVQDLEISHKLGHPIVLGWQQPLWGTAVLDSFGGTCMC